MKGLLKFAFLSGLGLAAWRGLKDRRDGLDDRAPVGSSGVMRDAGPEEQHIDARDWDMVDEQVDESFPASDPPGNYRGIT